MKRQALPAWVWGLLAVNIIQIVALAVWLLTQPLLAQPQAAGSYQICGDGQGRVFVVSTQNGRVKWVNPGTDPSQWQLNKEFWQISTP